MQELNAEKRSLIDAFARGLTEVLGESIVGIYLYGALVFPETEGHVQDIDYHVIVRVPLGNAERERVIAMRQNLVCDFGGLAEELDGYILLLEDLQSAAPPRHQLWPLWRVPADASWALHCAHIHAGHFITVTGPDPREIYPSPAWPDIRSALFGEITFVDRHLAEAPAYGILNATRILYSFTTQDVAVSKRRAAEWGRAVLPERWRSLIEASLRSYRGEAAPEDGNLLRRDAPLFIDYIWHQIADLPTAR